MTKQSLKPQSLHFFAALLLGLLILFFLKPGEHLTAVGVRVIAVMIPMLYLWLTANTHWTCLLALALLVTTGAMSANEVWAGSLDSFSMGAFCILIGVASGIAVATPSANIPSPLFFGPGHITMRSTWKANLAFVLAGFLLSVVPGIALAAALTA